MKNFIIIVPRYYPDISYGGPTLSVSNMAKKLFYLGYKNTLIISLKDSTKKKIDHEQAKSYFKNFIKGNIFYQLKKILNFLSSRKTNVFILNSFFHLQTIILLFPFLGFSLINKKFKLIIAPRGELMYRGKDNKKFLKRIWLLFFKFINIFVKAKILFTSESELNNSKAYYNLEKNNLQYNLIPNLPEDLGFLIKEKLNSKVLECKYNTLNNNLKIVFVGRLSEEKGILKLIQALEKVNFERHIEFNLFGNVKKENLNYLEKCLSFRSSNFIINHFEYENRKLMANAISQNHIAFFPSEGENFCHGLSECISCYLPTFYSNIDHWDKFIYKQKNKFKCSLNGINDFKKDNYSIESIIKFLFNISKEEYLAACYEARQIFERNNLEANLKFEEFIEDYL